jgi:hypothetical protein
MNNILTFIALAVLAGAVITALFLWSFGLFLNSIESKGRKAIRRYFDND